MISTLATSFRLPRGIVTLLDSFAAAHPQAELQAWLRRDGAWVRVRPAPAGESGAPGSPMHTLDLADGSTLAVELVGPVPDAAFSFFQTALTQAQAFEDEARSAAREISEKYEEINLLYSISEILGSVLRLGDAAGRILAEVADVLGARRASLWVFDAGHDALVSTAMVGEEEHRAPILVSDADSLTARVFRERQSLNLERGTELPRDTHIEPRPHGTEALLSVPINYSPPEGETRTVGVITLVGRKTGVRYSAGDARLLSAIASQVGAALENQRLVQESLGQERLMRELELAHDLQLKLLPDTSTFDGAAEAAARCLPAESVGGDFYHLFRLSGGRLGVIIGDVSSHGFSAALIMALTMSAVAIYAQESGPPGEVLRRLHGALAKELESTEMYMTVFYGVLDPALGRFVYSNAGHPHAFVCGDAAPPRRLDATSPPLGIAPFSDYGENSLDWGPGDLLCLFTDGLSDAFLGSGEAGEARVLEAVCARRGEPVLQILDEIFALAPRLPAASAVAPADDRTAVLVRL